MKAILGPDGKPIAMVGTEDEQKEMLTTAILVECFGALAGLQQRDEWTELEGGVQEGYVRLTSLIVERVGREPIVKRFEKYGVRFLEENEAPPPPDTHELPPSRPKPTPANPYRVIRGGKP